MASARSASRFLPCVPALAPVPGLPWVMDRNTEVSQLNPFALQVALHYFIIATEQTKTTTHFSILQ